MLYNDVYTTDKETSQRYMYYIDLALDRHLQMRGEIHFEIQYYYTLKRMKKNL